MKRFGNMKVVFGVCLGVCIGGILVGCAPPRGQQSNHQNLNVEQCQKIAQETFAAGKISHNLCPGYMPDGQPVELF
jgi:hypothetical protein